MIRSVILEKSSSRTIVSPTIRRVSTVRYSAQRQLTFTKSHVTTLYLSAGIAGVRHVIHKDIYVATRLREFTLNELEYKQTGFYTKLAHDASGGMNKNIVCKVAGRG